MNIMNWLSCLHIDIKQTTPILVNSTFHYLLWYAGFQGNKGARGDNGQPGFSGRDGQKGFRGIDGDAGFPGDDGQSGRTGAPGLRGIDGLVGELSLPNN